LLLALFGANKEQLLSLIMRINLDYLGVKVGQKWGKVLRCAAAANSSNENSNQIGQQSATASFPVPKAKVLSFDGFARYCC
jgi:hypothetical protein